MSRNPFDNLILGGADAVHVQVNVRQIRAQQVLAAYSQQNVAMPELYIADRTAKVDIPVLGEDGQPMTAERRAELMVGKPTMADLAKQGDPLDVGQYDQVFTDKDIASEDLGASAVANRPAIRILGKPMELLLPTELITLQGLDRSNPNMSLCCYSAPYVDSAERCWAELGAAITKVSAVAGSPEWLIMSPSCRTVLSTWRGRPVGDRIAGLVIHYDPRLENEIRVCASTARKASRGIYASLFVARPLYDSLSIDPTADTDRLPTIKEPSHGQGQERTDKT